jgi:ribonuclease Z
VTARLIGLGIALAVAAASWVLTCGAWRHDRVLAGFAPLEPRRFERLTLITVGTGGARANPQRLGPCTAIGWSSRVVLVDAGRAIAEGLRKAGIPASQPDTVFLTSLLPENTVGLDDLLVAGWLDARAEPLRLVGPPGTRELADDLVASHARGIAAAAQAHGLPPEAARFEAVEIGGGWSASLGGEPGGDRAPPGGDESTVRAGALPDGPLDALAYRFAWRGRSAVVGGTGWGGEALAEFARGANLLLHEAVAVPTAEEAAALKLTVEPERLRREAALHTTIHQVGVLAQRAGVETLVLVRLRPPPVYAIQLTSRVDDDFAGKIVVAADGDEITP